MDEITFIKNITDNDLINEYKNLLNKNELELLYLKDELEQMIKQCKKDNLYQHIIYKINNLSYMIINLFYNNKINKNDMKQFKNILKIESNCLKILSNILNKDIDINDIKNIYLYLSSLESLITSSVKNYNILLKQNEYELKNINYYHPQDSTIEENKNNIEIIESYIKKLELKY